MVQLVYLNIIADFQADRNKTTFEKDVDDLLFGNIAPPPRRRKDDGGAKPPVVEKKPSQPIQ